MMKNFGMNHSAGHIENRRESGTAGGRTQMQSRVGMQSIMKNGRERSTEIRLDTFDTKKSMISFEAC